MSQNLQTQKATIKILTVERNGNRTSYKTDVLGWPSTFDPIVSQTLQQDKVYEVEYTVKPNPSGGREYKNIVKVLQELPEAAAAPRETTRSPRGAGGRAGTYAGKSSYSGGITGRDEARMIRMSSATNATSLVASLITTGKLEGDLDLILETVKAFTDQLAGHITNGLGEATPEPTPEPAPAPQAAPASAVPAPAQVPQVSPTDAQAVFKSNTTTAAVAAQLAKIKQQSQAKA